MRTLEIDALVIGGGVQGLMLLHDLKKKGYSVLLLELNKLGGGQTSHSHVFIHPGYLCRKPSLVREFKEGHDRWQHLLGPELIASSCMEMLVGFDDEIDATEQQILWKSLNPALAAEERRPPAEFGDSCLTRTFGAKVNAPTSEAVMEALLSDATGCLAKVVTVESFKFQPKHIEEVEVEFNRGDRAIIKPRAVLLAAGTGNEKLLRKLLPVATPNVQWNRNANLLVLTGNVESESPLFGGHFVVSGNGISIAQRRFHRRVVWLISDSRVASTGHETHSQAQWFDNLFDDLLGLAPSLFADPTQWKWGMHRATKAEGWDVYRWPYSGRIEKFGFDNLWTVWPTFLTLAPLLSARVCEAIEKGPGSDGGHCAAVTPFWETPQMSEEYWKQHLRDKQLQPWDEFSGSIERSAINMPPEDDYGGPS
jgi:glycine/D-amino acid oxidase-like deaminating enzyme